MINILSGCRNNKRVLRFVHMSMCRVVEQGRNQVQ